MATPSVPNTFANATNADATKVNANFAAVIAFLISDCIQKDGSLAFTAVPTGPATDPTLANHLTRKSYVDAGDARIGGQWRRAAAQATGAGTTVNVTMDTEDQDTSAFGTAASTTFTIPAGCAGIYTVTHAIQWATGGGSYSPGLSIQTSLFASDFTLNGDAVSNSVKTATGVMIIPVTWTGYMAVGDTVTARVAGTASVGTIKSWLSIWRVTV